MDYKALVVPRLQYYKMLGDKALAQLSPADYFFVPSPTSNSIAMLIQHLHGNMMSRFTNLLTEDGEKPWRKRDAEFEPSDTTVADLLNLWEIGWAQVFAEIATLSPSDLEKTTTIRGEVLFVYDALLRQLAHYPYHVGQILMLAKMIKDSKWENLSMPKRAV